MRPLLSALRWVVIAVLGAAAFGVIALSRGESVNAAWLLVAGIATYVIAYRFYARFIALKVFALDDRRATTVFRILQEALTNVARHAGAGRVQISFSQTREELRLEVADNGRGISKEELAGRRSLGLVGIRERAIGCGGELEIQGEPGRGTVVRVRIPCGADSAGEVVA